MPELSAYVPCCNNADTVVSAARSLLEQSAKPAEVFIIDDGSKDDSAASARNAGFRVVELGSNQGRGAARARAMSEAACEFVLACDATMSLDTGFCGAAMPSFSDNKVAAVFGRVMDPVRGGPVRKWRARHLFKCDLPMERKSRASLATWGAILRRSATMAVGNFNEKMRHTEDADLGSRLLAAGWDVVFEPAAHVHPQKSNTLREALERYWRWNVGAAEQLSPRAFLSRVSYSARVMARKDLAAGDFDCALISLLTPYYFLWRRLRGQR